MEIQKKIKQRTYGPVADLERHLPSDWWRTLFSSMYLKTDGDVIENNLNTEQEIKHFIQTVQLKPEDHVLDLCCGQGRHVLALQRNGFHNVMGLDRSKYLIRTAKKRAQQSGLSVKFMEGDARKIKLPDSAFHHVALFGNSFGYFDSQKDDVTVLKSILRVLKSNGTLFMDLLNGSWMKHHFEPRSWEWIDQNHLVCRERSLSRDQQRIISREVIIHAERGIIADQFYAERLYSFEDIRAILSSLHFTEIRLHESLETQSDRQQDLGMMANRIFISARAPIKKVQLARKSSQLSVTVLLGDPSLPDKIKLEGKYNAEDLANITNLKKALRELNVRFSYFTHHKKMIEYLTHYKHEFVLNLCDEGYNNNAEQELCVPALLDMLKIPYSGADAACLSICYNKSIVRALASTLDIPVPLETFYDPGDQSATIPSIFPAILKPNQGDGSIGITKNAVVSNPESLVNYIDYLKKKMPNASILIQEFLTGDEYSVAVIGNSGNFKTLPILKVDYSKLPKNLPKILGYESKWEPKSSYWSNIQYVPAQLDIDAERELCDHSMNLFERLGCRDYARFDYRADADGVIKLLEVNPNPGWCWDGKLNIMAGFGGLSYAAMLKMILQAALDRIYPSRVFQY